MRALALALALSLPACATTGLGDALDALAKDPATLCLTVTSVYGTIKLARINAPQGDLTCTTDGLKLVSPPAIR